MLFCSGDCFCLLSADLHTIKSRALKFSVEKAKMKTFVPREECDSGCLEDEENSCGGEKHMTLYKCKYN